METAPTTRGAPRWSRAALIVNTHSRRGAKLFAQARDLLTERGIPLEWAHGIDRPAQMQDTVRKVLSEGADLVIVGGGDGSLASTIGLLIGSKATFAALPLGTANSFARTLGIGADLAEAADTIAAGHVVPVDLVEVDGNMFVNSAAIGIPPLLGDTIPHGLKKWLGRVGYLFWAVRTLARFRPFRVTLTIDDKDETCWATEVRLLNGKYTGGIMMSEDAELDSGKVVIQIVSGPSRWKLARNWYAKMIGLRRRDPEIIERHAKAFTLQTRPSQRVSLDGEVLARTPIKVSVHPCAVNVVAPDPENSTAADAT